jgi:hypothetical protein
MPAIAVNAHVARVKSVFIISSPCSKDEELRSGTRDTKKEAVLREARVRGDLPEKNLAPSVTWAEKEI